MLINPNAGTPSVSTLTAVTSGSYFNTLTITVFPPTYAAVCIIFYTISVSSTNSTVLPDFNVTADRDGAVVQVTKSGFDLCNEAYNFSVVAYTRAGYGARSDTFPQDPMDFFG